MKKYEYDICLIKELWIYDLNERGQAGWELVTIEKQGFYSSCIFKREIPQPQLNPQP